LANATAQPLEVGSQRAGGAMALEAAVDEAAALARRLAG
jgi:hypothetical protein